MCTTGPRHLANALAATRDNYDGGPSTGISVGPRLRALSRKLSYQQTIGYYARAAGTVEVFSRLQDTMLAVKVYGATEDVAEAWSKVRVDASLHARA